MPNSILLLLMPVLAAELPPGVLHIPNTKTEAVEQTLKTRVVKGKPSFSTFQRSSNSVLGIIHRDSTGDAELHDEMTDVFVVRSGEAWLDIGGSMEERKEVGPGEFAGKGIREGQRIPLRTGDVVRIAAKVPHHVVVEPGKSITYWILKLRD
jgi:mannose-6-phosphate isomerase-like protein (cupin superfamily)